jgi:predicted ATPase
MAIILNGVEIENFKSYTEMQWIHFSDLSVLLGANSSGKSTALQALLALKQTMECNSPDEDLLLSGKYVALGDFDDVISDKNRTSFSLSVLLNQKEKSENSSDEDLYKISWKFERGRDGISAILTSVLVVYETLCLEFKKSEDGLYYMFINNERSAYSVKINNLLISNFYIYYDKELNNNVAKLLNQITKVFVPKKTTTVATDRLVSVDGIQDFYFRLMHGIQDNEDNKHEITDEEYELADKLVQLINTYGNMLMPRYDEIVNSLPDEFYSRIFQIALSVTDDTHELDNILLEHEEYINQYRENKHEIEDFKKKYSLGRAPFRRLVLDKGKDDNLSQIKNSLDFYKAFFDDVLSKIFFVGPIRENPKGLYNIGFETIPKYVGPTGAYFASVLLHENKKRRNYILPRGEEECTLFEALSAWMIHLNVASSVKVDKNNSFGFSVSIENMEQVESDIMNVGIGTSQVLPVLISVLLSEKNEILIFEQPELHLHPFSQSRLADMFTEFCKRGRKIIVETHSEYFILRLRYHIVKENYSYKLIAVNFFQNSNGTKVSLANISGFGNIDYPKDFRDETQELLNAIMDAALERKGLS